MIFDKKMAVICHSINDVKIGYMYFCAMVAANGLKVQEEEFYIDAYTNAIYQHNKFILCFLDSGMLWYDTKDFINNDIRLKVRNDLVLSDIGTALLLGFYPFEDYCE